MASHRLPVAPGREVLGLRELASSAGHLSVVNSLLLASQSHREMAAASVLTLNVSVMLLTDCNHHTAKHGRRR
jgi:hypothetical protein